MTNVTELGGLEKKIASELKPRTSKREDYQKKFGHPIYGLREDVEGTGYIDITEQEMKRANKVRPVSVRAVHVVSPRKNGRIHESYDIFDKPGVTGKYEADTIYAKANADSPYDFRNTVQHELVHDQLEDVKMENPGYLPNWVGIAAGIYGSDPYLSPTEQETIEKGGLGALPAHRKDLESIRKRGFMTVYSQMDPDEDAVELCLEARMRPEQFIGMLGNPEYQKIEEKVRLAQKARLIPEEFYEAVDALRYTIAVGLANISGDSQAQQVAAQGLRKAEDFLNRHPGSIYEANVRESLAGAYESMSMNSSTNYQPREQGTPIPSASYKH